MDGLAAAAVQSRRGGRPPAIDADKLAAARARRQRGESIPAIARALGVGRSTLYRALEDDPVPVPVAAASSTAPPAAASAEGAHADVITYALHRSLRPQVRAEVMGELSPREREEVEAALDRHRERLHRQR
ncbi:helix-turn-helix domain-containing protein [Planomonospora sp. ID67723]|uniref:helix-turn-helix domain-containing protein n=1 Tax=Planomonospora sp. ID67723 TaxID=2738134 RepID=UPI0018C37FA9|nr:helix-turn-helix domain-containing protein [Planomonospora sp. ID67723]MBG0833120.1 helix-turn-helix domain-containing protein [Planomonospora sp. ID67723]